MTPIVSRPLAAIVLLSLWSALAPAYADDANLPPIKTHGNVTYLSGGIGSDETAAIKAASPNYSLTLQFSSTTGAFLAAVVVQITDAGGNVVLDTTSEGPYLLVNLEPGRYTVDAMLDGISRGTEVTIKPGVPQKRSLIWPPRKNDAEPRTVPSTGGATPVIPSMSTEAIITPTGEVITQKTPVAATPAAASPPPALPARTTEGGIPYVTGGIGSDESAAIKAQFPNYTAALTFAGVQDGHNVFLASVPVKILDASGTAVLEVTTGGPYLMVDLPPGRYDVVASYQGREQRGHVEVGPGRRAERTFVWKMP